MENKSSRKYSRVAKLVGILSGFVLVLGTSYAVFRVTTTGEKENVVSAGKLDVRIENEQNEISLGNTLPQTEEEGKQNTPYTFDVTNKGTINAMYDLYIEVNNDSTLDASVIRYYLTVIENGEEKQVTPTGSIISSEEESTKEGKKAYKIDTKYLDVDKTNNYKLYLWIDYDATKEEAANKVFKANIRVDAEQIYKENKLVKQVDVSENNDGSVTAYMYGNDTVVIKGKGKIKSGLSDSLKFVNEEVLSNYKNVLKSMGVDVSNINTLDDLQNYIDSQESEFNDQFNDQVTYICAKETLKNMDKDSSAVTDMESLVAYLQELGWMDEEGSQTDTGEEFFTKFEDNYNKNYSLEGYSPSKIIIEDGITNIPKDLFGGNENIKEVKIPSSVKTIDDSAFSNCSNLTSIMIPSGVTSIGNYAFSNCSNLTSITLPDSVTSIGNYAFSSCSSLTSIMIPDSVTSIGSGAFSYCRNLTSITLPSSVTSIANYAFHFCSNLTSITIPDSVTSIGGGAFSSCNNLASIKVPNSVTSIGNSAFSYCKNLISITIPDSVTSIGSSAFSYCSNLISITIPNSVTSIADYAFDHCSNLTSITIPDSVTSIGRSAFQYCSNLASITIPASVTNIAFFSFDYCDSLMEIKVDSNNKHYTSEDGILYNKYQTKLIRVPEGKKQVTILNSVTGIERYAFYNCSSLTSITIPNSVTSIEGSAFENCSSLTSIMIPNSVTNISYSSFNNCTSLIEIKVDSNNKKYTSEDGVLYNENKTTLVRTPEGKKQVTIPNSVTSIGNWAFYNCSNLTSITLPDSVTSIGSCAFYRCSNLISIMIPNNVESIESSAFCRCSSLTSITIPNSVTSVGSYAFDNCSNLTTINIDNTSEYVDANWSSEWKSYCNANINYLRT